LQLSSFALKQSSGPVGVQPAVTTTPSLAETFFAMTLAPGAAAPGDDGPHARLATVAATTTSPATPSGRSISDSYHGLSVAKLARADVVVVTETHGSRHAGLTVRRLRARHDRLRRGPHQRRRHAQSEQHEPQWSSGRRDQHAWWLRLWRQ